MSKKSRSQRARERPCNVFWGSHGCRKQAGHSGIHFCSRGCPIVPGDALITDGFATWDAKTDDWKRPTISENAAP